MLTQNDVIDGTTHPVDVRVDAVLKSITEFFITQSFDEFEQMKDCVNFMMLYSKNDGFEYIRVGRFFGRVAPFRNRSCEVKKEMRPGLDHLILASDSTHVLYESPMEPHMIKLTHYLFTKISAKNGAIYKVRKELL